MGASGEVEDEGEDVLGDGGGGVAGDVTDGDVFFGGSLEVDVVGSGGCGEDEF